MDRAGVIVAPGDMEQQMRNCYSDLEKILKHYGYTYDDLIVENIYTTSMTDFLAVSVYEIPSIKNNFLQASGWK
jgi:2-iminobutanoate/2-iminopropanoate deaminase